MLLWFSCLTLCDPMDCSMPGLPVPHHLPEFTQVHIHCIGDAIQPSHPLLPSSPPALNLSQHQGLFWWVSSSHQVAKVLEASASASVLSMSIQGWFPLGLTDLIFFLSKGLFKSSPALQLKASILWCLAFFMVQLSHVLSLASLKFFFRGHATRHAGFWLWIESVPPAVEVQALNHGTTREVPASLKF